MMTDYPLYKTCIDACLHCASVCNLCSSACTQEINVKMMAKSIQLAMECAVICYTTAQLMSLGSSKTKAMFRICISLCEACANECEKHEMDHCQECAAACRRCAAECRSMIG